MVKFVEGIKSLFSGGSSSRKADEQAAQITADNARAREQQQLALDRQAQDLQTKNNEQDQMAGRALRAPRGRRLLLAATGEQGVSSTLGG